MASEAVAARDSGAGPLKKSGNRALWVAVIAVLVLVLVVLAGIKALQIMAMIQAGKKFVPPPDSVTTAKVEASEWQASRAAIGTLVAVHNLTVSSELPGIVRQINFDSGEAVRAGAPLVKLDTTVEEAQLSAALADATLTRQTLDRQKSLRASGNNSPSDLDAAEARFKQSEASVAQLRATISKKSLHAPFDGRLGIRQVELGQILSPGTPLTTLQSVNPIYAEFSLPQQTLADLQRGMQARLHTDAFPGANWDGRITTINSEVDVATRSVRVRATFPNQDGRLRAGMFANVEVLSDDKRPVLLIPQTAVIFAPYGDSVFSVEEKKGADGKSSLTARQKFVRLGEKRGDLVAVENGVVAGETIVSSGAFKLRNGSAVVVKNDLAPDAVVSPRPTDR